MNNTKAPCYNCANRCVTPEHNCHTDCESYQAYCRGNLEQRAFLRNCRAKDVMASEMLIKSVERSGHKEHGKRVKGRYK